MGLAQQQPRAGISGSFCSRGGECAQPISPPRHQPAACEDGGRLPADFSGAEIVLQINISAYIKGTRDRSNMSELFLYLV